MIQFDEHIFQMGWNKLETHPTSSGFIPSHMKFSDPGTWTNQDDSPNMSICAGVDQLEVLA